MRKHRESIEHDLLLTGHTIEDIGRTLSWSAFGSYLRKLGPGTATARELHPELYEWTTTAKTNAILADIYDVLASINANLVAFASGKRATRPKLYPRPGNKKNENNQHFGSGAMKVDDLEKWMEEKRRKHGRNG